MIEGLKPYAEYKESDIPWARALPRSWQTERAKRLFTKMDRPVRPEDEVVTCFRDGMVTLRKNRRLRGFTEATVESGYQGIRKGDLVIHGMDAFAGAIGVSDSDGKGTPVYNVCQPRPGVNARYYAHTVREMSRAQWILALAKGIRERSTDFRYEMFGNQFVPLPPPDEQAAIVRFLDHANRKIDKFICAKRKLIGLLNEQKQAIIHQAVTRGLNPDVPLKPSGIPWLGDIPANWKTMQLRQLLSFGPKNGVSPQASSGIGILSFSISAVRNGLINISGNEKLVELDSTRIAGFCINKGDILLVRGNGNVALVGKCGLVEECPENCIYPDILMKLRPNEKMNAKFMVLAINSSYVTNQVSTLAKTSNGAFKVSGATVRSIAMVVPPYPEQIRLIESIETETTILNTAIARTEREIALMQEYRIRLTSDIVTGKLDVREAAAKLPDLPFDSESDTIDNEMLEDTDVEENEA